MLCKVFGCVGAIHAKGMCHLHYRRVLRNGITTKPDRAVPIAERFWPKVKKSSACWEWVGARNSKGYGLLLVDGRSSLAHRVSWILSGQPIPTGLCVLHQCDNPPCVRPSHLFVGTMKDNVRDMFTKGRDNHARGEQHPGAKLTERDVRSIRERKAQGVMPKHIAAEFKIGLAQIHSICTNKRWKHI